MKITKSQLKQIIKEELEKILNEEKIEETETVEEAGRPHSMRGGRTMADLDKDAKTRETDFLKKKEEEDEEDEEETQEIGN
jgi:predicted component of type VI protein secretion system